MCLWKKDIIIFALRLLPTRRSGGPSEAVRKNASSKAKKSDVECEQNSVVRNAKTQSIPGGVSPNVDFKLNPNHGVDQESHAEQL